MQTTTFKDWTLSTLEKAFSLKQVWQSDLLDTWQNMPCELNEIDQVVILKLQKSLIHGGRSWNETELENKFISPLIMQADIDDEEISYFLERPLSAQLGDYQLSGIVDGMIATGFREPGIPMFCMHEYKRSMENQGSPEAQVLAAMLVARELNPAPQTIYGLFVVGLIWNFMALDNHHYCISKSYHADDEEVFVLLKMLKNLKQLIRMKLSNN